MKSITIAFAALMAAPAFAAGIDNSAASNSASGSASYSNVTIEGTTMPGVAPSTGAPSMSSGHPCAYTEFSFSLSIIGGGASAGGQTIDDACMLGQMGYTNPAVLMIAARNPDACRALLQTGHVSSCTINGRVETRAGVMAPAPTQERFAARGRSYLQDCTLNGNQPIVTVKRGANEAQQKAAVAECMAQLGY